MSPSILLAHPDPSARTDIEARLAAGNFRLIKSDEIRLADLNRADLALVAWSLLKPADETLGWIRRNFHRKPPRLVVLSDRPDYSDAVRSLECGADDCVVVPVQGDELLVRVHAVLARPLAAPVGAVLQAGPIMLDRRVHCVSVNDQSVELAPTEFRLLAFLLEHQGRVFSRSELLARAWSTNVKAGHRTVDVHVRRLRQQLEPFRCAEMIQTVRGFGYRLRAEAAASRKEAS